MSEFSRSLRDQVRARAQSRCEYCRVPEEIALDFHEVDHIIALKHGGPTELGNLALCCMVCNGHKGSDLASIDPATGQLTRLFHPRNDRWDEHFEMRSAEIVPLTDVGRVTVRLLKLNAPERLAERAVFLRLDDTH